MNDSNVRTRTLPADEWEALRPIEHCAVADYSRQMRKIGHYPEKVLVAVKSAVRDIATPIGLKPTVDALVTQAAQWCISAYFDGRSMEKVVEQHTVDERMHNTESAFR